MDAIDRAIEEALKRQREGVAATEGTARKTVISKQAAPAEPVDPWSPEGLLRAANEDDDLYDPYSDYMDALNASGFDDYDGQELI